MPHLAPPRHRWLATLPALLALAALAMLSAWAGTPPRDEPIEITQALAESQGFPLRLARPGRYRLAQDLLVPAGRAGLVIEAEGVQLDLNGFSLRGPVLCSLEPEGTVCDEAAHEGVAGLRIAAAGARVHNGHVRGFAGPGLLLQREALVEDLLMSDNAGAGLHANTSPAQPVLLRRVQALRNGGDGFWLQTGRIEGGGARRNGGRDYALGALAERRL